MGPKTYYCIKTEGLRLYLLEQNTDFLPAYIFKIGLQKFKLRAPCPSVVNISIIANAVVCVTVALEKC